VGRNLNLVGQELISIFFSKGIMVFAFGRIPKQSTAARASRRSRSRSSSRRRRAAACVPGVRRLSAAPQGGLVAMVAAPP
jgi:hypothetical protein